MFQNYFKTALRHLFRQPQYAILNILGLTIGLASSFLILLYLFHELSYDKYHEKADRIYRVSADIKEPDDAFRWATTQSPLAKTLKHEFAEVEEYVRFFPNNRTRLELDAINYFEDKVFYVDSTVFNVFTFDFISGDKKTALNAPNTIVLSKSLADRIFKGTDPIGKTLKSDGDLSFQVTGVYQDMPSNSHLIANVMISATGNANLRRTGAEGGGSWGGFGSYNYVLLKENADSKQFEAKLDEIIKKYVATIFDELNIKVKYVLLPLTSIHLHSNFEGEPEPLGNINYIYIFSAVGVFLLLIACINYMNLATARSARRSLEVGIRKVVGAERKLLIGQFLTESVLLSLIALIASFIFLFIIITPINSLLGTNLHITTLLQPNLLIIILGIVALTGILGGSYPAFYLSAFNPISVIQGSKGNRGGSKTLRRVLVTLQFAISMFMFVGTTVIYNQMQYVQNKDLGFDKDQILTFNLNNRELREKWSVLKNKLEQNPNIISAATVSSPPGQAIGKGIWAIETADGTMDDRGLDYNIIDFDYFPTMGVEFVEGRNFSQAFSTDTTQAVIVNEAMVKRMNWKEGLGKRVQIGADSLPPALVVGVVKDFHQTALYNPIETMMFLPRFNNGVALVKIKSNTQAAIDYIRTSWQELFPTTPFEYTFVDQSFMEQYETDQLRGQLFLGFSLMTILIACLGLLGLASYTSEQRSKEISIRKILGANTTGLTTLLVKDFVLLVMIAAVPAFAIAWYMMNKWLATFQYHTNMGIWIFALVFFGTAFITIFTTGFHAWRAATTNPAENLKHE
ncbi:MAG: ABC transporter permease [Saprospiraceae bacterium]|nr:ABC transporter permease [Saprospiraceae bacterium]